MFQGNTALDYTASSMVMTDQQFSQFSCLILEECGIRLSPVKKTMLSLRLLRRLRALSISSFGEYYSYVTSRKGYAEELALMIDAVSTNKTEFFRESSHFEFMVKQALPAIMTGEQRFGKGKIQVLSAGCSSGEEPYTIAMVLADFLESRSGDFAILATDISTAMLQKAVKGVYPAYSVESIPMQLRSRYLMRGKGPKHGLFRIVPELRNRISFRRLNLTGADLDIRMKMDMIFCRNVIIYFDRQTQKKLFEKFYDQLNPGGYLFIGHSESLHGISEQFQLVSPTVYRKPL